MSPEGWQRPSNLDRLLGFSSPRDSRAGYKPVHGKLKYASAVSFWKAQLEQLL